MAAEESIRTCPPEHRPAALRALHGGLSPAKQVELVAALQQVPPDDDWQGLLVAGPTDEPRAAAWIQPAPGQTGVLWPPSPDAAEAELLFRAAGEFAASRNLPLVQMLVADDEPVDVKALEAGNFGKLANLAYMAATPRAARAPTSLVFEPRAGDDPSRLAKLIEQTYQATRDCPALDGVRAMSDVLFGYRAHGQHLPDQWYFVCDQGRDVGALLLANHPTSGNWELVYMGATPSARGTGLGKQIVEFALDAAFRADVEQLVLAVDVDNDPAIRIYRAAGFQEWNRCSVYARLARE